MLPARTPALHETRRSASSRHWFIVPPKNHAFVFCSSEWPRNFSASAFASAARGEIGRKIGPASGLSFGAMRASVSSPEIYRTAMRLFHHLLMLLRGLCCPRMGRFMRVPRRGCPGSVFLPWGASDRADGKHKFTPKTFSSGCRSFFLDTPTGCGHISPHAQDSVVVHRVTPSNSPVLGRVIPHFSPSYSQCQPPPPSSCLPFAPTVRVPPLRPAVVRCSVCPKKASNLNVFSATRM